MVVLPDNHTSHDEDVSVGQAALPLLYGAGITAVFCYNDMLAVGVLLACRRLGIAVPAQLSVVGFDDIHLAGYMVPALTTIHQPKVQLGQMATQVLLDLLQQRPGQNHILLPTLVQRASTARPVVSSHQEASHRQAER